jgi:hypothetical protein
MCSCSSNGLRGRANCISRSRNERALLLRIKKDEVADVISTINRGIETAIPEKYVYIIE